MACCKAGRARSGESGLAGRVSSQTSSNIFVHSNSNRTTSGVQHSTALAATEARDIANKQLHISPHSGTAGWTSSYDRK